MVKIYEFGDFFEVAKWAKGLPKTQEGVVVTFDNGFKTKLKGVEWCQLAKMLGGFSKWNVWRAYYAEKDAFLAHLDKSKNYKPTDDELLLIPEELPDIRAYAESLREQITSVANKAMEMAGEAKAFTSDPKGQYQYVSSHFSKNYISFVMKALSVLNGKNSEVMLKQLIHKYLEPSKQTNLEDE